jgi:hypothetical protein
MGEKKQVPINKYSIYELKSGIDTQITEVRSYIHHTVPRRERIQRTTEVLKY